MTLSAHRPMPAVLGAHRRGLVIATLAVATLGLSTALTVDRMSEEHGEEDSFAIVDYDVPTSTTTAAASTTVATNATIGPPVEVLAEVVTRPPQPVEVAPRSTETSRTDPPLAAADDLPVTPPPTTELPTTTTPATTAPTTTTATTAPPTTARPTTTTPTTTATTTTPTTTATTTTPTTTATTTTVKPGSAERPCTDDDRRGKCKDDAESDPGTGRDDD